MVLSIMMLPETKKCHQKLDLEEAKRSFEELMQLIRLIEFLSTKIHAIKEEEKIFDTIVEEFKRTKVYRASILLLDEEEKKLNIVRSSLTRRVTALGEKISGARLSNFKIDLNKSSIYRQVVTEGLTVQTKVSDIVAELFPQPMASIISKVVGYYKRPGILAPLKKKGKCIGVFAMSSTQLGSFLVPSVTAFTEHLSIALELAQEQRDREEAQKSLKAADDLLRTERMVLQEKNIAMKVMIKEIETQKRTIEGHIAGNVEKVLLPIIDKLKKRASHIERKYLDLLEQNLRDIASPFLNRFSGKFSRLTPRELEVCNYIKNGLSSKEIADLLNISILTVHRYREFIRRKLEITNKGVSISSLLNTNELE